jgi:GrpB-like predicted nucleotidyltransferase (UPF0157 family)
MGYLIKIVDYDDSWPQQFTSIAAEVRTCLESLALRIDHIGSTSIPGLAAKDRIDIQVTILSASKFESVRSKLEGIGYNEISRIQSDHIPPGGPFDVHEWEKRIFGPPETKRPTNLHVRVDGRANQRYPLLFRDYLRQHANVASAYALVKRQLAHWHPDNTEAYCEIKDPVCDIIAISAQEWAKTAKWLPGPSDA